MHTVPEHKESVLAGFGPIRSRRGPKVASLLQGGPRHPPSKGTDGYLHTEAPKGAKSFALCPLSSLSAHPVLARFLA